MNEVLEFFPGAAASLPIALAVALVSAGIKRATLDAFDQETAGTRVWKRFAPLIRVGFGVGLTFIPGVEVDPMIGALGGGFSAEVYNLVKTRAGFKEPA